MDRRYTVWNNKLNNRTAMECHCLDLFQAFVQLQGCQSGTTVECSHVDALDVPGNIDRFQRRAIFERMRSDRMNTATERYV